MSVGTDRCTVELAVKLGGGDYRKGIEALTRIVERLEEARQKHDWKGYKPEAAYGAITGEVFELGNAIMVETPHRQREEALDVAVTALRFWLGDMEQEG